MVARCLLLALTIAACSESRPPIKPVVATPSEAPAAARDVVVAPSDAAAATPPDAAAPLPVVKGDPAEPVAPMIECDVSRRPVYCQPGLPTRTALQPSPFHWCQTKLPGSKTAMLDGTGRLFSAAQTRLARKSQPDACCYLEWTWGACD